MPNARLRQIYVAMMQARVLAREVPTRRRNNATLRIEACLVSPVVDLGVGDLVSDALGGGVVEFLRGAMLAEVLGSGGNSRRRGFTADCGKAARIPDPPGALERIWAALGAAAALKAEAARAKIETKAANAAAIQAGVVVVYVASGEVTAGRWRKALKYAREKELPMLVVVLPAALPKGAAGHASKPGALSAMSIACGVPGIAVDADDAVALYRVAQESIGHARIGCGPAMIECVPFVLEPAGKRIPVDAIVGLEQYMLQRGVATRAWMDRERKSFVTRTTIERAASKKKST